MHILKSSVLSTFTWTFFFPKNTFTLLPVHAHIRLLCISPFYCLYCKMTLPTTTAARAGLFTFFSCFGIKLLIPTASLEAVHCLFWQQLCVKKRLSILDASPQYYHSCQGCHDDSGGRPVRLTQFSAEFLVAIYRRRIPPVSGSSDKAHINFFSCSSVPPTPTLFFIFIHCFAHMYTVIKSVALQM